jgi:hypothetical protein
MAYIELLSSLDCCSKKEIEENKKKGIVCDICNNTGYLSPNR